MVCRISSIESITCLWLSPPGKHCVFGELVEGQATLDGGQGRRDAGWIQTKLLDRIFCLNRSIRRFSFWSFGIFGFGAWASLFHVAGCDRRCEDHIWRQAHCAHHHCTMWCAWRLRDDGMTLQPFFCQWQIVACVSQLPLAVCYRPSGKTSGWRSGSKEEEGKGSGVQFIWLIWKKEKEDEERQEKEKEGLGGVAGGLFKIHPGRWTAGTYKSPI